MRPTTDLIEVEGTFSNWVSKNTEFIKQNKNNRQILLERLSKLRDENVSISEEKIKQLQQRVTKAKNELQLMSVFYHAAISHLNININTTKKEKNSDEL